MKRALALSLLLLLASAAFAQVPDWWFKGSLDEAFAKAKAENKLVLLDFNSFTWPGCKLLGEQFYDNPQYRDYLSTNFVLFRVYSQEPDGKKVFEKYGVRATPTIMFFDGSGEAVDWILGYDPPADKFKPLIDKVLKGEGTFKSLMAAYAKNPKAVDTAFKLGRKYEDRYDMAKASEFYKKVVELDPKGAKGTTDYDTGRPGQIEKVTYTQYAEFNIGAAALSSRPAVPGPMMAFIKKYPDGEMVRAGYQRLSGVHFLRTAPKEEAASFYADWTGRFPKDSAALSAWVQRILLDKEPVDKGIELAAKAIALVKLEREAAAAAAPQGGVPGAIAVGPGGVILNPSLELNLARLYALKGDKDKAVATVDEAAKAVGDNARMIPGLAQAYLDIGAEDKAMAVYGPAFLQKSLAAASAITPYAAFWARQDKNLDSALEAAKRAVEMNPTALVGWTTLAQVYVKMKNAPEAIKAADKALEIAPAAQKAAVQRLVDQIKTQAASIK